LLVDIKRLKIQHLAIRNPTPIPMLPDMPVRVGSRPRAGRPATLLPVSKPAPKPRRIDSFRFRPGRRIGSQYVVESRLGGGSEGEVYRIRELHTDITRAAKVYFPHVDPKRKRSVRHARKLNKLRSCPIVLQYHHTETVRFGDAKVPALISELCPGEALYAFVTRHKRERLGPYRALHVLYNLVRGLEAIHAVGEYHGDVHTENIIIQPRGVKFDLKLIDFYDWGQPAAHKRFQDVYDAIGVFYDILGGAEQYRRQPTEVRYICGARRWSLIQKRFPTITALRHHLESFEWESPPE